MVVSLSKRLLTMLDDEYMTDVVFDVQGQQFKCHKLILSSCETRLKEMVAKSPQVKVDDVAPHTFQAIIKFLYTDDCTVTDSNVFELMHAAKVFEIGDLEHLCSEFIRSKKLSESNVSYFTSQALHFDAKDSLNVCLDYFKKNIEKVLTSDKFLDTPWTVLKAYLENRTDDCSESSYFAACVKWAKAECKRRNMEETRKNLRKVLGDDLINEIEYEKMKMKEFVEVVVPAKLLTHEEIGRHIETLQEKKIKVSVKGLSEDLTTEEFSLLTSISEVKKQTYGTWMYNYNSNQYTLGHQDKVLHDDMTLADLYTPGEEELHLAIHSFDLDLTDWENGRKVTWCPLKTKDLPNAVEVIAGFLHATHGINPTDILFRCPYGSFSRSIKERFLSPNGHVFFMRKEKEKVKEPSESIDGTTQT